LNFNPPLTPGNGTPGVTDEIVSVNLTLSGCGGVSNPGGLAPSTATSVATKSLKIKATKVGKTKYAGGCNTFVGGFLASSLKSSITWNNGISNSKATFVDLSEQTNNSEVGFDNHNGTTTKSFAGPASLSAFFDSASSNAIVSCAERTGGSIPSVTIDSSTSLMGIGTDAVGAQVTFSYNGTNGTDGSPQSWTVPSGVNLVLVTDFGAQGSSHDMVAGEQSGSGGLGGESSAGLSVSPGETLIVTVGGQPAGSASALGGYNGGAPGGAPGGVGIAEAGAGGGGASDVRQGGGDLAHRVVIAGGGGGGGYWDNIDNTQHNEQNGGFGGGVMGGSGGAGQNGAGSGLGAGGGGSASAGGTGGVGTPPDVGNSGNPGTLGDGGSGGTSFTVGAGGGGGYYGGGGGGVTGQPGAGNPEYVGNGPGGGGSGFIAGGCTVTACSSGVQTGNGSVTIVY